MIVAEWNGEAMEHEKDTYKMSPRMIYRADLVKERER